jgi:SAM-dependent methyltransferase
LSNNALSLLPLLYADDHTYGWSAGMRAATHALLAHINLPDGPLVEIGCGGGQLLAELHTHHAGRTVVGCDLHPLALAHARTVAPPSVSLTQAALPHLPWLEKSIALIVALDVFDQQGVELSEALAEVYRLLQPDGALLLRVSAHPALYGAHDVAFHTGQRYTYHQVQRALLDAGFAIQRLTYANALLSPPVAALRLVQRWGMWPWRAESYQHADLHQLSAWLLQQEARWLRRRDLPWGLSLCALARKP